MRALLFVILAVWLASGSVGVSAGSAARRRAASAALPQPAPEALREAGLSSNQSDEALKLYNAKCLRCHKSYDPRAYTSPNWQTWMAKMSKKARLESSQDDLLARYLQAVRATPQQKPDGGR